MSKEQLIQLMQQQYKAQQLLQ
jgi:hypothetical protein